VPGTVTAIGAGAGMNGTEITVSGDSAFQAMGAIANLSLAHLAVNVTDASTSTARLVNATAGAHLTLRDIALDGGDVGVMIDAAFLDANGLSVRHANTRGISLAHASDATIDTALVRDGGRDGIVAETTSHLDLSHAYIASNAGNGVALIGSAPTTHHLDRVSLQNNTITGLRAEDSGTLVQATLLYVSGTLAMPGTPSGDGLYVGPGADVRLDPSATGTSVVGTQSQFIGNARAGILVSGDAAGTTPGSLTLSGALVASNLGPGIFVETHGVARDIAFSRIADNAGLGIGLTSAASLLQLRGSTIASTRMASLTSGGVPVSIGDGLSAADGTASAMVSDNDFSDNARFAAVFSGASATLVRNTGDRNGFAVGTYGGTVMVDMTNTIRGNASAPTIPPPIFHGALE
jgi:hypothetical protein